MRLLDYMLWATLHLHYTGQSMGSAGFMRYYPDAELPSSTISPIEHGDAYRSQRLSHHHSNQKHLQQGSSGRSHYTQFNSSINNYSPHSSFVTQQRPHQNINQILSSRHSLSNHKNHPSSFRTYHSNLKNRIHQHNEDEVGGQVRVGVGMNMGWGQQDGVSTKIPTGPRFDRSLPRNVTVQVDKTAVLSCRVLNSADKAVSWIRHADLHILTVDKYRYTTDKRVSTVYNEAHQEWVLRIRKTTHEDAGMYECQISTKPILSFIVNMEVVDAPQTTPFPKLSDEEDQEELKSSAKTVPRANIMNGPEIYVHHGSLINLTCVVTHGTDLPVYIYWYHHNKVVEYEGRGDVTVSTRTTGNTISTLVVLNAGSEDSGKYSCKPSNGEDDAITLHVLQGEHSAPMQTNTAYPSQPKSLLWQIMFIVILLTVYSQQSSISSSKVENQKARSNDSPKVYVNEQEVGNPNCRSYYLSDSQICNPPVLLSKTDYRIR